MCVAVENSDNSHLMEANLHTRLLGGSRGNLGMVMGLRGLHGESHHRGCDGGRWSVVVRDLRTQNSKTHPDSERIFFLNSELEMRLASYI